MVYALSTEHQILLAGMAAVFIVFALLSSFYFPTRSANFPGPRLGWFVLASIALFLAMMAAVLLFGVEEEKPGEHAAKGEPTPAQTEPAGGGGGGGGGATGDLAAGKKVFTSAGCTGCHTLKAAGASGNVGPNLDDAKPDEDLIRDRVEHGKGAMPSFAGTLSKQEIDDVVAFVYGSTHS